MRRLKTTALAAIGLALGCVDHVYDRTSSTVPEFFTGPEGDTVYFSNLAKAVR